MFVFCNPTFKYDEINLQSKNIIFIDKEKNKESASNYIPCLFIPEHEKSSKFLIYFHGNSDDIINSELFCQYFSEKLRMNVIIVEYPGYSIYFSEKNAEIMCEDSLIVYEFIKKTFKAKDDDIYIVGRSLGTGPAVYLSSIKKPKNLFLISPFKSIKSIKNAFVSFFLLDIFKSIDIIDKIKCQIFFIHGKNDTLIDFSHSEELFSKTENSSNNNILILNQNMTHNDIDIEKDIFNQIKKYLKDDPQLFPKNTYNLNDTRFKNLFDYPEPIQRELFKLNIKSSNPTKYEISAKYAFKLNDGRIAFGFGNSELMIYNYDGSLNEKELSFKLNNSDKPISYINQLRNNLLIVCTVTDINFFLLKRYKYELVQNLHYDDKILKVEQLISKEIIILCSHSIKILNEFYKEINEINIICNNFEIISNKIILTTPNYISINEYNGRNGLITIQQIDYNPINSIKNIISLNENNFIVIGQTDFLYYDLNNYIGEKVRHDIFNPSCITKLDNTSFLIWNRAGKIVDFEMSNGNFISFQIESINGEFINSIIKLFDGSLIISKDQIKTFNSIKNSDNENCIIH